MRNLAQYPITALECEGSLVNELERRSNIPINDRPIGSIDNLCLSLIREFLSAEHERFTEFLKKQEV